MPYETIEELPDSVREAYSDECQRVFLEAFNDAEGDEEARFEVAHTAARNCEEAEDGAVETESAEPCICETGTKILSLKEASVSEAGEFSGYGNTTEVVDDQGDNVRKGAFKPALDRFLREGFISWQNHNWAVPVAYIEETREDSKGLFLRAKFHTTPVAQEARTITTERLAAGKTMGLSIGYEVDKARVVDGVREITRFSRIFEVGLVMVPANSQSLVTAIKGAPASGTLADRLALVSVELEALRPHVRRHMEMRRGAGHKEGRVLSFANRERLKTLKQSLNEVLKDIEELLRSTDPDREKAAQLAILRSLATLSGVDLHAKGN